MNDRLDLSLLQNVPEELRGRGWVHSYLRHDPKRPERKPGIVPCLKWGTTELRAANLKSLDHVLTRANVKFVQKWIDKSEGFVCVDLDHVRDPETGNIEPWALEIVETFNTYTELSKSGKGLHIVGRATLDEDFHIDPNPVEIYSGNISKMFAFTGRLLDLYCSINDCQAQAEQLLAAQKQKSLGNSPAAVEVGQSTEFAVAELRELKVPDMPESVLDGRLGEICQKRLSKFPIAYSWGSLLVAATQLIPNSEALPLNLYWCPVGPQGSGKSQAQEQALCVVGLGESESGERSSLVIEAKFGSAEGLLHALRELKGENRLLFVDELGHLLEKAQIDRSSFPFVLNTAYYRSNFDVTMAKQARVNFSCRLSLAGGVVEENYGAVFGNSTTGGTQGRFLHGLCPKPFTYLYRPYDKTPESLEPKHVRIDREVWDARDEWVKTVPGLTPRLAEHALRCAAICAAFDGRTVLRAADLGPAFELAKYQVRVRYVLQPNPGENPDARCAFAIVGWLKGNASNGERVSKRELYKVIHAERFGPGVYDRALKNLLFGEEIELQMVGKKAIVGLTAANCCPQVPPIKDGDPC
jgi:hypothetical protein